MKTLATTNNAPPEVGATLQRLRLARGLTLEDLSRIAGVSKSMLSQIEREKANPTIAITWRLANALGVQIGGIGVLTLASIMGLIVSRRLGLKARLMAASDSNPLRIHHGPVAEGQAVKLGEIGTLLLTVTALAVARTCSMSAKAGAGAASAAAASTAATARPRVIR